MIDRAMQVLRIKEITETLPGVGVFVRDDPGAQLLVAEPVAPGLLAAQAPASADAPATLGINEAGRTTTRCNTRSRASGMG